MVCAACDGQSKILLSCEGMRIAGTAKLDFYLFDSLANEKILARSKLKAFADDKKDVVKMMISILERVENTVGKGENTGYQYFLLFSQCFPTSLGLLNVGIVW